MSDNVGIMRAYSASNDMPEQAVEVVLHRPEAYSGEPIVMPLTIRDVHQQMGENLKRWYPDVPGGEIASMCMAKVDEEVRELWNHPFSGEEMADVIISLSGYAWTLGIDLQAAIERKLAIVSARTDQAERDRQRGIE